MKTLQALSFSVLYQQLRAANPQHAVAALMQALASTPRFAGSLPDLEILAGLFTNRELLASFPEGFLLDVLQQVVAPDALLAPNERAHQPFFTYLETLGPLSYSSALYEGLIQELFSTRAGNVLLADNQHHLLQMLPPDTLNLVIPDGPHAGKSYAYLLSRTPDGRALLAANQNHLANLLSQETLNQVIAIGPDAGLSVAFCLAATTDGQDLLAANEYRLANLITQETLNHVIAEGPYAGLSVALLLAATSEGNAILAANQHRLVRLLFIMARPHPGEFFAFLLAAPDEVIALLAANQHRLANNSINQETLNPHRLFNLTPRHEPMIEGTDNGLSNSYCVIN